MGGLREVFHSAISDRRHTESDNSLEYERRLLRQAEARMTKMQKLRNDGAEDCIVLFQYWWFELVSDLPMVEGAPDRK